MANYMVMIKLNLNEVKAQFSKYVEMVESGEVIVICKRNVPVAEIRALGTKSRKVPELGWAKGMIEVPRDFNEMPVNEARLWEEGDENDPLRKYAPRPADVRK